MTSSLVKRVRTMTETSISYAKVLYELGIDECAVARTEEIFRGVPQVKAVLSDPTVEAKKKYTVIERIFPEEMQNFLKVMCDYHRMDSEEEVFKAYHSYRNERQEILSASLCYVTEPDEARESQIRKFLCQKYKKKEVELQMIHMPELLGGFLLRVGSFEYDWSIRGRLQRLRTELVK